MEIWKDIPNFEGLYQVSNIGRVKSVDRIRNQSNGKKRFFPEKIIKPFIDDSGYPRICIYTKDATPTKQKVHRLVAMAFIPNPDNKPCVGHLDNDRMNPKVENLVWCTVKENAQHCIKSGRQHKLSAEAHPSSKPVIAINKITGQRTKFGSQKHAAKMLGLHQTHVNGVITGRDKSTGGYIFIPA
jgi:hypothetical protein